LTSRAERRAAIDVIGSSKALYITSTCERPKRIIQRTRFGQWKADSVQFLASLTTAHVTIAVEPPVSFSHNKFELRLEIVPYPF